MNDWRLWVIVLGGKLGLIGCVWVVWSFGVEWGCEVIRGARLAYLVEIGEWEGDSLVGGGRRSGL